MMATLRGLIKKWLPKSMHPDQLIARWIEYSAKGQVVSGPFVGMRYVNTAVGSKYYPKILGIYEKELHPFIEILIAKRFDTILNIGAGEGYYAVGLAHRNPDAHVIAFEMDVQGQALIRKLAQLNSVAERITICGLCKCQDLAMAILRTKKTLIIMDVEGAEVELLNPQLAALENVHVLVEVHNFVHPRAEQILVERFNNTHHITKIAALPRTFADFPLHLPPLMNLMPKIYFEIQMGERPAGMSWLYLEPKLHNG